MTQARVTPGQARELLYGTTPGPWTVEDYKGDRPEVLIESHPYGTIAADVEPDDAPLIAAAPALAELVANMRYEYAVQVKGGWWVGENDAGELVPTTDPMRALRHYHPDVALKLAEEAGKQLEHECCVARRLTTDWEVEE